MEVGCGEDRLIQVGYLFFPFLSSPFPTFRLHTFPFLFLILLSPTFSPSLLSPHSLHSILPPPFLGGLAQIIGLAQTYGLGKVGWIRLGGLWRGHIRKGV